MRINSYITLRVLLVTEWRHELIANDWRSMARNLTVVSFSVMFTILWLMLQHWHTSLQGEKTGSGNTFADSGYSCLLNFQLHDKSLFVLVEQVSLSAIQIQFKIFQHSLGTVIFVIWLGCYLKQMIRFSFCINRTAFK